MYKKFNPKNRLAFTPPTLINFIVMDSTMPSVVDIINEMSQNEKETMCYVTSAKLLNTFNPNITNIQEQRFTSFGQFKRCLEPGYVYNIELHFKVSGIDTRELANGLDVRGVMIHMLKKKDLRLFTHAFNFTLTGSQNPSGINVVNSLIHSQSWCKIQNYSILRTLDNYEAIWKYLNEMERCANVYIANPMALFELFGVRDNDLRNLCDIQSFRKLFSRVQVHMNMNRSLKGEWEIIVQRKPL